MVETNLTPRESQLLKTIVLGMGHYHRIVWLSYLQSNGFTPTLVETYDAAEGLWQKGWLKDRPDMVSGDALYLSREAWNRFALDEWDEIEEAEKEKQRGEASGSW